MNQSFEVVYTRTGAKFTAKPIIVGFSDKRQDMFRLYREDGTFKTIKRGTIWRWYTKN